MGFTQSRRGAYNLVFTLFKFYEGLWLGMGEAVDFECHEDG